MILSAVLVAMIFDAQRTKRVLMHFSDIRPADKDLRCPLIEDATTTVTYICRWTEKAMIRLHGRANLSGPSVIAYCISALSPHCVSCRFVLRQKKVYLW